MSLEQNFPLVGGPVLDARGNFTQAWLAFFRSMWNRTGQGAGVSAEDAAVLALLSGATPPNCQATCTEAKAFALMVAATGFGARGVAGPTLYYDLVASEALSAWDAVNIWSDSGAFRVRKADTTSAIADPWAMHGFVQQPYAMGATARVWFVGLLTGVTGTLTPGYAYLGAAGAITSTPNATPGQISQIVGVAVGAHAVSYQPQPAITT